MLIFHIFRTPPHFVAIKFIAGVGCHQVFFLKLFQHTPDLIILLCTVLRLDCQIGNLTHKNGENSLKDKFPFSVFLSRFAVL